MLRISPMENWLGSSTKKNWVDGRSRSTRRVGVVKMKKDLMGSLTWFVVMTQSEEGADGLWSGRWRRWMAFDGWRRKWLGMVASMVGVDGGLGSSTQRALTLKSHCVPSGENDTHSSSLLFV